MLDVNFREVFCFEYINTNLVKQGEFPLCTLTTPPYRKVLLSKSFVFKSAIKYFITFVIMKSVLSTLANNNIIDYLCFQYIEIMRY